MTPNKFHLNTCKYLLILSPNGLAYEKIMTEKRLFAESCNHHSCSFQKPQILLASFLQYEMGESRMQHRLKLFAQNISPLTIALAGFYSHPSHTIYFNIQTKNEINNLLRLLKKQRIITKIDEENKPHFIDEPAITLASKLQPWQYEKGWLEWSNRNFLAGFTAKEMILLKQKTDTKAFFPAQTFSFEGKKEAATQVSLFA